MTEPTSQREDRSRDNEGLIRELIDDGILPLDAGDRLWKLYFFRPEDGRATRLEHRIYTKVKPNGNLAMVTFAVHTPGAGQPVRSGVARVADLTPDALDHIIDTIRRETQTRPEEYDEIDVSHLKSLPEQLDYLRARQGPAG